MEEETVSFKQPKGGKKKKGKKKSKAARSEEDVELPFPENVLAESSSGLESIPKSKKGKKSKRQPTDVIAMTERIQEVEVEPFGGLYSTNDEDISRSIGYIKPSSKSPTESEVNVQVEGSPRRRPTLSLLDGNETIAEVKVDSAVSEAVTGAVNAPESERRTVSPPASKEDSEIQGPPVSPETSSRAVHVLHEQPLETGAKVADIRQILPTSPRRKATLSTLDLQPDAIEAVDTTDANSEDERGLKSESDAVQLNNEKDVDTVQVDTTDANAEDERGLKSGSDAVQLNGEKDVDSIQDAEVPRRNLDPDGMAETAEGAENESMGKPKPKEKEKDEDEEMELPATKPLSSSETKDVEIPIDTNDEEQKVEAEVDTFVTQPVTVKTDIDEESEELPWAMYKGLQKKEKEKEDELPEVNSEDELGGQDGPLPDFDDIFNHLNSGDGELESENNPPPLFGSTQQKEMHKYVDDLKLGLAEEEINEYLDQFEKKMEEEILMIGSISLEDVQVEERRLREEHIGFQQQQAKVQRDRKQEIMIAMERAKKHVMQRFKEKYRKVRMREEHLMQRDRLVQDKIHRSFRRSENQLLRALKKRKGEVKTLYGDLIFADGQYGGSKGRRWKVDWNKTPQPIQIRLNCLRGVKDKLPASRYVLMVSLYDRLGGHVMKWSNLKGQQWGGATLPLFHGGEFFNIELKIDQSVFTVCPARPDIRPGMVLVYELFILRGSVTPTDKVVAWGCFPICDKSFNIVEGKYKTPLLRGDMDPNIDKFSTVEKLMALDLENWLCNLYFEIVKLPRYMAGQKEYEVELQFSSSLVSYPRRTKTGEEFIDGEKPIYGSHADLASIRASRATLRSSHSASFFGSTYGFDAKPEEEEEKAGPSNMLTVDKVDIPSKKLRASRSGSISSSNVQLQKADMLSSELRHRKISKSSALDVNQNQEEQYPRAFTVHGSRKVVEEKGVCLSDYDDSSGTDFSDDDVYNIKKDERYKAVKGQPGMFYKIHQNNPADVYARKMYTMLPKTPKLSQQRRKKRLSHLEELQQHTYGVKPPWSNKGHIPRKGREKAQYISRMLLAELGLSQWRSAEFWAMLLMLTITWWIRMFLHYLGQLGLIYAMLIPINKYQFLPYTVTLNYQNTLLKTREEIGVIVIGHFTNIFVMMLLVIFSWFLQALFGRFPSVFSKFIMAFGLNTVFDPFWILVVDSALLRFRQVGSDNPIGDAFKLYWHFNRYYTNDNVLLFISISITLFLYITTVFCACTILYMYFLRLHNKGRMMDVFWRLQGSEEDFFLPFDLEISHEEITFICKKAEQWRGEEGERRKTAVYDYVWEEEEIPDEEWDTANARGAKTGKKEITTHVSIHTIHLDGLRELHRHFLRSPEGAIVEVFQEMNVPGVDEAVKAALTKGTNYQGIDGLKRKPSFSDQSRSRASSRASSIHKGQSLSRRPSYFLDVPTFAPV